jgi:Spy/CpxP family protein refolding chaperone
MKRFLTILALTAALALPGSAFAQAPAAGGAKPNAMQKGGKDMKHPEIWAAMSHLREAKNILDRKASNDFEGHKHQAVESIEKAMEQLHQALGSDDQGEKK